MTVDINPANTPPLGGGRNWKARQLLHSYLEQGVNTMPERTAQKRSAQTLPRLEGLLALEGAQLSNAALFELLDA
jgi:hypothetical protein